MRKEDKKSKENPKFQVKENGALYWVSQSFVQLVTKSNVCLLADTEKTQESADK